LLTLDHIEKFDVLDLFDGSNNIRLGVDEDFGCGAYMYLLSSLSALLCL